MPHGFAVIEKVIKVHNICQLTIAEIDEPPRLQELTSNDPSGSNFYSDTLYLTLSMNTIKNIGV